MKEHKNVKSVLKKLSERKGIERIREYKLLAGDPNTEVTHKESGCRFKLDPRKVYFSGREGTERLRIAEQVKPNEFVLVMFSGVSPFSIIIARKQPQIQKIISIEINPIAHEYAKENIRLNKVQDKVIPILGDVREKVKDYHGKCDRVIMPLPHEAYKYLDLAYKCLKPKGGIIHLYLIEQEKDVEKKVKKLIHDFKKKTSYTIRKVLPYAPYMNKYCVDISLQKD
ncbi:MAG: class I SAM-dependent methyltransferase family protein [Thermoprotei archaeon]|nr:MAG: class I SAM-dependent methyltransferase family protein [Thermoprotei archaeon]